MARLRRAFLLILAVFLVAAHSVWAESKGGETITRQATGQGTSRKDAITDALLSAIEQATGVLIKTTSEAAEQIRTSEPNLFDPNRTDHYLSERKQTLLLKLAGGYVKSYKLDGVTSDNTPYNPIYTATITAEIALNNTAELPLSRRSLVVGDFAPAQPHYSSGSFIPFFAQSLAAALTQSQRFAVLERGNDQTLANEIKLLNESSLNLAEWLNNNKNYIADYVVSGQILAYDARSMQNKVAISGEVTNWVEAQAQITYRVLEVKTRQVKFAATLHCSQKFTDNGRGRPPTLADAHFLMAQSLASRIAAQITQDVYPYRVLKADGRDNLVINQGGSSLKVGEELLLIELGDAVEDPDTHEKIRTEREIGRARINRTSSRLSSASLIAGGIDHPMADMILRRPDENNFCDQPMEKSAGGGGGSGGSAVSPASPTNSDYGIGANGQPRPVIKLPGD